jgi:hypothetical protein
LELDSPPKSIVLITPQIPALGQSASDYCETWKDSNKHKSQTQAYGDDQLLLLLHVQIPDEDPRQDGKVEIHRSTPC